VVPLGKADAGGDAASSGLRRCGHSGVRQPEVAEIYTKPLCHALRQSTAVASTVHSARQRSLRLRATGTWFPGFSFSIWRNVVILVLLSPRLCHTIPIDRRQLEF